MKILFKIITLFVTLSLLNIGNLEAQVGINADGSNPDASAILDVKSTDKGILIPRMTTTQRTNINSPAKGLMVFDNDLSSFYYYDGSSWLALAASTSTFEYDNANKVVKPNDSNGDIANDDFVFGSLQLDDVGNSDHDSRFFFDKSKGSFRAGDVKNDFWDDANIGNFSVAFGKDTKASGKASLALGRNSVALGDYSFSVGDAAQANSNFSLAIGDNAISNNIGAVAIGSNTNAGGLYSVAFGFEADATNTGSMAFGYLAEANGVGALAVGYQANATSDAAMAFGYDVTANETGAVALGYQSTANEFASVALGYNTIANGKGSVAVGYENTSASAYETTIGLFATNYTANDVLVFNSNDRLFTIGNGIDNANRSDAFSILKNGNTFINGALTLNNAFTFPTTDGTNGQVLMTDGSGALSWSAVNGGSGGNQILSISGSDLTISNGNTLDISSVNTNVFSNDGTVSGNRNITLNNTELKFTSIGKRNAIIVERSGSSDVGISFKNSGLKYPAAIVSPNTLTGNNNGLDFYTKGADIDPNNLGATMRLTDNGTMTLPEYGQGNITGTLANVLGVTSSGDIIETNISDINQDLSISGNTLSLSGDATDVDLSNYLDNTDNQDLSLSGNTLSLTNDGTSVNLSGYLDNTDAQGLSISGSDLTISNGNTLDISSVNTDAQALSLNTNTNTNTLTLVNGGSINLSGYLDNTDNQDLTLSGNTLSLTNDGTTVDLSTTQIFAYDNTNKVVKPNTIGDIVNDDFVFGSPQLDDANNADYDNRLFFDKSKGAFRAGSTNGTKWDNSSVGDYSAAFGLNNTASAIYSFATGDNNTANAAYSFAAGGDNTASGLYSFAIGSNNTASKIYSFSAGESNTASGNNSTSLGRGNTSASYGEMTLGVYATTYTPNSSTSFNSDDRLFTVGNGANNSNRSDALVILKNGNAAFSNDATINGTLKSTTIETAMNDLEISGLGWGMNFYIDTDANSNNRYKWYSDNNEVMTLDQSGNLTIDGNLTQNSDIRLKKNFQRIEQPLAKIEALNGYYYHWKNRLDTTQQVGVIAQEVEAVLPQLVTTDNDGFKAVEYTKLTALLIEGMKAQQQQIADLQAENQKLQAQANKINQLEAMLLEMKAEMTSSTLKPTKDAK